MSESTVLSPEQLHDELLEQSKLTEVKIIDLKELDCSKEGIRIKYYRYNRGRQEECYFPQRGEVSNNYTDEIDDLLQKIAMNLLDVCGLEDATWNNPDLKITNIKFAREDTKTSTDITGKGIAITAKIVSKNELLNKQQSFTTPRLSGAIIDEYYTTTHVKNLLQALEDFYNGKIKVEQFSLSL